MAPSMLTRHRTDDGLTVAEMLVVVALVAIVATIVFPVFSNVIAGAQADADARSVKAVQNFVKEYEHWNLQQVGPDIVASMPDGTEIARITGDCATYCGGGGNGGGGNGGGGNGGGGNGGGGNGGTTPQPGDTTTTLHGLIAAYTPGVTLTYPYTGGTAVCGPAYFQWFGTKTCIVEGLYAAGGRVFSVAGATQINAPWYRLETIGLTPEEMAGAQTRDYTEDTLAPYVYNYTVRYSDLNQLVVQVPGWSTPNYSLDGKIYLTINGEEIQIGWFTQNY
jgi:prepilin-type N-terminal cleavage/methylation domain-containing protein